MLPQITQFINVEKVRDGGSWAASFNAGDANRYILFSQIVFANARPAPPGWEQLPGLWVDAKECFEKENFGHAQPFLIHSLGKPSRVQGFTFGEFNGRCEMVSWGEARQVMSALKTLAGPLDPLATERLGAMAEVIDREGKLAPDAERVSRWFRP